VKLTKKAFDGRISIKQYLKEEQPHWWKSGGIDDNFSHVYIPLLHQASSDVSYFEVSKKGKEPVYTRDWLSNCGLYIESEDSYDQISFEHADFDTGFFDKVAGASRYTLVEWAAVWGQRAGLGIRRAKMIEAKARKTRSALGMSEAYRATLDRTTGRLVVEDEYPCWLLDSMLLTSPAAIRRASKGKLAEQLDY